MADLREIQSEFADAVRDPTATSAARRWLAGDDALIDRRLAVYRANLTAGARKALSATYPVVRQVVGDEFFDALARAYLAAHPSTSGDLNDFGAEFACFLFGFEPVRSLPYLPDLARLELAVQRAESAADAAPWDPGTLAAIEPERQNALRFDWAPGTAVIDSAYPIVRIWTIHQPGHDGEFSVDWNAPQNALVGRDRYAITVTALDAAQAAFLRGALAGAPLETSAHSALQLDAGFDLGSLLGRALSSHLICGFSFS